MTDEAKTRLDEAKTKLIIYPAVDLLGGRCVRLRQGSYDDVTVYSDDPLQVARTFQDAGAAWLHVVDLDAARTGLPAHADLIVQMRRTGLHIQTGGGIRDLSRLRRLVEDDGIDRVVLGTAAVKDRVFTEQALRLYPERIAIGLDARDGKIAIDGWTQDSGLAVLDFARLMAEAGARIVIYTDISRDGMMRGPATEGIRRLAALGGLSVIASGGISSAADIEQVRQAGADGVIVGKAIYEKKVVLSQCWPKE